MGNRRERDHWGDLGVHGWIIIGWIYGKRRVYSILFGKPVGKRPLERHMRRLVDNIWMDMWGRLVYSVLVGKTEEKRPLGRPRRIWVYNSRMDLWEEGSIYGLGGESIGKETARET